MNATPTVHGKPTPRTASGSGAVGHSGGGLRLWVTGAILAASFLWAYWPVVGEMAHKWQTDPQFSHGYLVPLFALYLVWFDRDRPVRFRDSTRFRAAGWLLLAVGVALRWAGAFYYFDWFEAVSLVPVLAGVTAAVGGPTAFARSWRAIAFLAFMIPLPFRIETALSLPLQRLATRCSTYVLQTLGRPAFAEGNVIIVNDARIGVVEACNGLGMLLLFFAVATAVAMLVRRTRIERAIIVLSAVPIAVAANVIRVTASSLAHEALGGYWSDVVFHDLAGWLMMPIALGLLWLELAVLSRAFVDAGPERTRGGPLPTWAGRPA